MTTTLTRPETSKPPRKDRATEARRVAHALEAICDAMKPGDRLPAHTALMVEIGASERIVLRALGDLCRAGRIVRRPKSGTYIADAQSPITEKPRQIETNRNIVAITRPDHAFFSQSVEVLMKLGQSTEFTIMFQPTDDGTKINLPPLGSPQAAFGYIVIGSMFVGLAESIHLSGHRCVFIGEETTGRDYTVANVHVDNHQGGFLCAEHLINLGHRRLAFAMDTNTSRWSGHERAVSEARMNGLDVSTRHLDTHHGSVWKLAPDAARSYFDQPDAPTAICAWNDSHAMELIKFLRQAGLRVPEDVSVIGYDNLVDSGSYSPALSTIDTGIAGQLRTALRLLTEASKGRATTVLISPTLLARESTSPPRA